MMGLAFRIGGKHVELAIEDKDGTLHVRVGDRTVVVDDYRVDERYITLETEGRLVRLLYDRAGAHVHVAARGESYELVPASDEEGDETDADAFVPEITSPMPGKVLVVEVAVGDEVEADQALLLLEAMKMEQTVRAPTRAKVSEVRVEAGRMVGPGAVLIVLEEIA